MDSGEGGDGGGGEERESDLSPQGLSAPLRSAAIPEQRSPTHTSAMAPAKESLTLSPHGAEEVQGDEQTEAGLRGNQREGCLSQQMREEGEVHLGVEEASVTGSGGQEEEEAISNQSQNKSKCSLLPQQSQHCSSSSTAQASGTLDSKTAPTPSSSPKPAPSLSASPKHFTCSSSSSALHPDTEVKDIKGDQGWISGFPQSFKSQQSTATFPALAGTGPASSPTAEDEGMPGVLHSSVTNGNGAKAPEPNDSQPETEVDDEREKEDLKEAVLKNLNQDLSPNSLTSHMTIMHSRNSCKTLKCPKCNWHYKSQHTLQVHMKEKHPETGGHCVCGASGGKCVCGGEARGVCTYCSSGKPHPRLARGETYACGYKPYRCEVCDYATSSKGNLSIHMQSDKHLNNVQNGGNPNGHVHVSNSSTTGGHTVDEQAYKLPLALHTPVTQPAKITSAVHSHSHGGKRWRCDVCDYETSIARNLRIHTTSEKHTHNMLRLQRGYYLSQCRGLAPPLKNLQNTGGELSLSVRLSSQQVPDAPVTLGSALTPSPSPSPSPPPAASLSPSGALSLCVFQCLICSSFSSDSLESVEQHLNAPRSLPQSEWCSLVAGGCHCRLCGYTTPLRANFSLHCQTDRHRTRYQLAAHLQEGGDRGQEGAALIAKGNPVQLRCNLCDYVSSSLEKLRGHSLSAQHKAGIRVYRFLQQYDGEVDGGSWLFHCLLCNHSCSSKIQVLKHSQTPTHQQREGLIQLQPMGGEELAAIFTIRKNTEGVTEELSDDMDTTSELQIGPLDQTKDTSNTGSKLISTEKENGGNGGRKEQKKGELKRLFSECTETDDAISNKRPKIHQQNENQQTVQCPLCQLKVPYTDIRQHLTHVHSVAQDCVDKLISTVTPPVEQPPPPSKVDASPASCTDELKMKNGKTSNAKTTDTIASADGQKNGISTETTESEVAAPKDVTALLTPPLEDNTTHPSSGKVAPQSPSSPPTSPSSDPPPLTDRHGYRFRCSRCSLAFPTQEKLQLHWQYHAMRAATECPLCSRQCRSQEALQRHMQNTHSGQQLDNSQGQNTHLLPHTAHYMEHNKSAVQQDFSLSPQIGQEAGEGEDEEMEEEEALESDKKEQLNEIVGEVEEGLTDTEKHEEAVTDFTEASSNSLIKKSSNPTLDRYLDPSRPYKCTICSESFTQKNILLVHFNSVSHLHRARRALQDSSAGSTTTTEAPRGPDPRPYRCKLCGVGYSQSSTLDIHLRSVLHQTRARAALNTSANASTSMSTTQAREEPSKGSALTKRPDATSSSASTLLGNSLVTEAQSPLVNSECQQAKKRVAELLASRNQLMLLQQQQLAQAQAQAHLQQQTALLQSQVMHHLPMGVDNLLKHHFPVAADNLLSLQQQLLLPFYLAGDMKLNPELAAKTPDFNQFDFTNFILKESTKTVDKNESLQTTEKHIQKESSDENVQHCEDNIEESCSEPTFDKTKTEPSISEVDKGEVPLPPVKNESQKQEVNVSPINLLGQQCPPPRVPYAAVNGEPLRALLQSYGYELALQYIQSRHRHQQQSQFIQDKQNCSEQLETCLKLENGNITEEQDEQSEAGNKVDINKVEAESYPLEMNGNKPEHKKEEKTCCGDGKKCKDCGKSFSDVLILKSHQEYIHKMLFPTSALEKFSKEYRSQYDQMYPITQSTATESSPVTTTSTTKSSNEEPDSAAEVKAQIKPCASSESPTVSEPPKQTSTSPSDVKTTSNASNPPPSPETPALSQEEETSTPSTSGTTHAKTMPLSLSQIPMLPLPLPQLPMPPLPLSKLTMPPIPFPMELPLLPPVVMQSVTLQSQPWLDSNANTDLAKLYQSQLNQALLGQQQQQPQSSSSLLAQQSPLSPALLAQPPQLNTPLLGQASQPSPIPAGQQPQMTPSILEQQGKRTRTRISEEQLAILRKHFDINSLPSDEELNKMSTTSGLPHKVIKHWFRNTLFKERQRDKDSPYNFNNPPTTALEESREEEAQSQCLSLSPSTMSPALTSATTHPQPLELQRELHRGRRSSRTRFTEQQLETLQGVFEATPYPREEEYERLSALLSLPNRIIVVWFQNARQRARKNQDRGNEESFGGESKNHFDSIHTQSSGGNMNNDEEENRCVDGQADSHNENSMDLTYEYYTNPESPSPESSAHAVEPVKKIQDDQVNSAHDSKTTKNVNDGKPTVLPEKTAGTQDSEQPCSSQKIAPVSDSRKESTNPQAYERSAVSKTSKSEDRDTLSSLPAETKQQSTSQPLPTAQFQCTFCPMSLPSFQQWQEHQTRHLLAAQSQVQLLHSGFTDRTMPYMMLHPNHTLMANQMLSGTMSQLHPTAAHPMISHLNSLQMKNTLPDHSGSLSQNALGSMKPNSKLMAEVNFDSQRGGKDMEEEHRRDKRQRTTITPEQLEVLYQRYSMDSNPTRGVLESIARDVGLTRRVVQVWFQNTRARERKGQFRSMGPGSTFSLGLNHLRCPFCRALFKVKSALDAHMRSRHWAEAERAGFNLSISNGSSGQMATSSVMERPGPSISSSHFTHLGYPVNKEPNARPPTSSLSITTDLNNPDEDEDYEEEEDEYPCEESSSMADLASSSPEGSGGPSSDWGETPNLQQNYQHSQQQRQRTQMSHFQILQLRDFYRTHRTPNRQECEALGQELGLPHRVVQVWFQNARAKEKRARSMSSDSVEREAELSTGAGERDRA